MIGAFRVIDKLGHRVILILKSYPCSWGRCIFCPFTIEQSTSIKEVIEVNRNVINEALRKLREGRVERVSIFNGSSFHELPLDTVLRLRPLTRGRVVDIEERSEYVTKNSVEGLINLLEPKELVIRVGFEVWDEGLRENYLRKGMPDSEVRRLVKLRKEIRTLKAPVKIVTYVLFGIDGIPEHKVAESVKKFKELFDGVIAIKYRRYLPNHPRESKVSNELRDFLERNADLVDWGEGEEWVIGENNLRVTDPR